MHKYRYEGNKRCNKKSIGPAAFEIGFSEVCRWHSKVLRETFMEAGSK